MAWGVEAGSPLDLDLALRYRLLCGNKVIPRICFGKKLWDGPGEM
jgi:hypothetical protein